MSFDPQQFKGLNNSQVFAGAILIDAITFMGWLAWLFNQEFKEHKFYIFLGISIVLFIILIPFVLYKFLFKVEEEITKRVDIVNSKEDGLNKVQKQIEQLREKGIIK